MPRTKGSKNKKISDIPASTVNGASIVKTQTIEVKLSKHTIEALIAGEAKKSAGFQEFQSFEKYTMKLDKQGTAHIVMVNPLSDKGPIEQPI